MTTLHGDRVSLRGDHMQFRVLLQTACHRGKPDVHGVAWHAKWEGGVCARP